MSGTPFGIGEFLNARQQTKAAESMAAEGRQTYAESAALINPFVVAGRRGVEGLERFADMYEKALRDPEKYYKASPGFNWLREQGEGAIARAASVGGNLDSGETVKKFADYTTGLVSQDYGNYLQRIVQGSGIYGSLASDVGVGGLNALIGAVQNRGTSASDSYAAKANAWNQFTNTQSAAGTSTANELGAYFGYNRG